ncbi:MAG: hypothetical protein SGJ27_30930 [Candidatus Melainabacteria bacterium]|nr:hypothetical protein [Candidatus Melainabacteria bacterium]
MDDFKQPIDIELNEKIDSVNEQVDSDDRPLPSESQKQDINSHSSLIEPVSAAPKTRFDDHYKQSKFGTNDPGNVEPRHAAAWLLLLAFGIGGVIYFVSYSRSLSISNANVVKLEDLNKFAGKEVLVRIKGVARSAAADKVVFQKLRILEPGRYGRAYEWVAPRYFSIHDGQNSILIDGSKLAEFASAPEQPETHSLFTKELLANSETAKALENKESIVKLWTIKNGDGVEASGQLVWDKQQEKYILQAPSILTAPLAAGLIQLKTTSGLETF